MAKKRTKRVAGRTTKAKCGYCERYMDQAKTTDGFTVLICKDSESHTTTTIVEAV